MIKRYTRNEMDKIWELNNKYQKWLDVEIAACDAWAELGEIPIDAIKEIKEKSAFDVKRIDELEATIKHDVIAFLTCVAEHVGPESRYIHKGLTSSDILDTALALQMREAANIIINDIKTLLSTLKDQAYKYKETHCMGRSHGVHAEPMTFGLKFALWYEDMKRNLERIYKAKEIISIGKLSGAVGTFSSVPPELEVRVLKKLDLKPEPVATQIVQRDRHAEYMITLALIGGSIEKIAVEIRHLQRTEVREAEEPFSKGQKGSSAMPHKRNPVGCENLSGLARLVRSNSIAALENIPLWHERDISHSSTERVIIPDSTILIDYMLNRLNNIISNLHVYPETMLSNIDKSYGLFNSQKVLLSLTERGMTREDAYQIVQRIATECWSKRKDFKSLLKGDKDINNFISPEEIDDIFEIKDYLRNIEYIFNRVFD